MNTHKCEILLVEDDPADAELTSLALSDHTLHHKLQIARDGAEALDYVFCRGKFAGRTFAHPPCLILTDLKLPRISGHDVLRAIKADARTRAIPVVVLTSSNHERDLAECYQLGANSYIQKPVDLAKFQETVNELGLYWLIFNHAPPGPASPSNPERLPNEVPNS